MTGVVHALTCGTRPVVSFSGEASKQRRAMMYQILRLLSTVAMASGYHAPWSQHGTWVANPSRQTRSGILSCKPTTGRPNTLLPLESSATEAPIAAIGEEEEMQETFDWSKQVFVGQSGFYTLQTVVQLSVGWYMWLREAAFSLKPFGGVNAPTVQWCSEHNSLTIRGNVCTVLTVCATF